jgi:hypothetical protein
MRWLYADPRNPEEAAFVKEKLAAIDRWWQAFQGQASHLEKIFKQRTTSFDLPRFMEDHLQVIDESLMWEFGQALRQPGQRLVITPESQRHLRPLVRTLLERAPKLPGWEFYAYRPAESAEMVADAVKARVGTKVEDVLVEASLGRAHKVNLHYTFPKPKKLDEETASQAAFVATETLMGEQVLDTWIGEIGLSESAASPSPRALDLPRAQATVAAVIRGVLDQLPAVPRQSIVQGQEWKSVELEPPEEADDYEGRSDVVVATIQDVELFEAIHCGLPFSSTCFSKVGETFCYLKLDGAELDSSKIVDFRAAIEEAINPALLDAKAGCVIGGGSGLRYAYIDLALTDIKRATPVLRQILAEKEVPARSWLLFNDDDLAAEWIAMHPETPPPPGA